ncbi:MAG: hypothetical protein SPE42_06145 [Bacteroides uniformis]|nr:hypothetical protein [Bacteroides bouchesdurhonensis]MDY4423520.1 hypothetical protein [Bacteroides uniformis]
MCKTCGEHRPVCRISRISLPLPYLHRHTSCRFRPSTLLIGTFGFQLVVDVLFIIAIEKTALETFKDIGGMVAVDNAVLSVKRLVARNFPVENTAVFQVYACDTIYRLLFLCMKQ